MLIESEELKEWIEENAFCERWDILPTKIEKAELLDFIKRLEDNNVNSRNNTK